MSGKTDHINRYSEIDRRTDYLTIDLKFYDLFWTAVFIWEKCWVCCPICRADFPLKSETEKKLWTHLPTSNTFHIPNRRSRISSFFKPPLNTSFPNPDTPSITKPLQSQRPNCFRCSILCSEPYGKALHVLAFTITQCLGWPVSRSLGHDGTTEHGPICKLTYIFQGQDKRTYFFQLNRLLLTHSLWPPLNQWNHRHAEWEAIRHSESITAPVLVTCVRSKAGIQDMGPWITRPQFTAVDRECRWSTNEITTDREVLFECPLSLPRTSWTWRATQKTRSTTLVGVGTRSLHHRKN